MNAPNGQPIEPGELLSHEAAEQLTREIAKLCHTRDALAKHVATDLADGLTQAEEEITRARRDLPAAHEEQLAAERNDYQARRKIIFERFDREYGTLQEDYDRLVHEANASADHTVRTERTRRDETKWNAETVYEAVKKEPARKLEEFKQQLDSWSGRIRAEWQHLQNLLTELNCHDLLAQLPAADVSAPAKTTFERLQSALATLEIGRAQLTVAQLPRFAVGGLPLVLMLLLAAALAAPTWWFSRNLWATGGAVVAAMIVGIIGRQALVRRARNMVAALLEPLKQTYVDVEAYLPRALAAKQAECEQQQQANLITRNDTIARAEDRYETTVNNALRLRDTARDEYDCRFPPQMRQQVEQRDHEFRQLEDGHRVRLEQIQKQFADSVSQAEHLYQHTVDELHNSHKAQLQALEDSWSSGLARIKARVDEMWQQADGLFPSWGAIASEDWQPPATVPPAMKLGVLTVGLRPPTNSKPVDDHDHLIPSQAATQDDARPAIPPQPLEPTFDLPLVVPCPHELSVLLEATGDGRREAAQVLQAYMLRLITALPPAKCRFTIIDPVGLGENFAAFMHLADYDDQLITHRIWTDARHIEQRLADLSDHMENVIQKYLRNEFQTIDQYNRHAEEVAEPFRFLVVANFPANFSEAAARRLQSIAASGPRCGVFVLLARDADQPLPPGISLPDLHQQLNTFTWCDNQFVGHGGLLSEFPLRWDSPPTAEQTTKILHRVGQAAKVAGRVEVPFEAVAPAAEQRWQFSSQTGLEVPLGRAGARRLQALRLGSGTSQHVLVAGKTGSGKSTLLHALVVCSALRYSPDELELYLVDFKQGVEFKTYASHALPHARVVAIESDREFGLSVLERLDTELRGRAEQFRAAEVQDLAGYRAAHPDQPMPRIVLVVDEFQEFFTEDDRVAHEAALLLDRLVRQGRAFGIHILLGSQTLAGAYSLARSTLGQMAVRIALQCSESDAHLILSEDNTAARLLSRAGEAIYNDSNGLVEGNHPFQVVWLPDERRDTYLDQVTALAQERGYTPKSQVIFEGNAPADLQKNSQLAELLSHNGSGQAAGVPVDLLAWLGEAVSIKDPSAASFRRQAGANLLMVGQNEDAALGMFTAAAVSLLAQQSSVKFKVFNGALVPSPAVQLFATLEDLLPGRWQRCLGRGLATGIDELAAELTRRQQAEVPEEFPPIFLLVHAVHSLRDLRKEEDDFSFSRSSEDKPPSPAKQFSAILRDGPPLGIHTLVWCDTLNNLNRTFDRQHLREFDQRVVLQMSGTDSSTLIDTPAASKLGMHRALLADEAIGKLEKFRPYRVPSVGWLEEIFGQLSALRDAATR